MSELEEKLGYRFKDATLLERALVTPAVRMIERDAKDNQRLEFLGDAVFGLLSAEVVFRRHPDEQEGLLTVRRTRLVSGAALAEVAEKLGLRAWLKRNVGAHEIPPRAKLLADAMEAIMGAVWLDGGLEAARAVFMRLPLPFNAEFHEWDLNPKGYLQIRAQTFSHQRPVYELLEVKGSAHEPIVTVRVTVVGMGSAEATAGSKSAAEVAAAAALLKAAQQKEPAT